jgi:predicted amidohydrolase YtcJ
MLPYTPLIKFWQTTAIAIQEGKIIAIGTKEELADKYQSRNTIDAKGKFIYPVYLMHIVILQFCLTLQEVDLRGTKSMEEIIAKIQAFKS